MRNIQLSEKGKKWRRYIFFAVSDFFIVNVMDLFSLLLRYEFDIRALLESGKGLDGSFLHSLVYYMPLNTLCMFVVFAFFKLYTTLWEFAGYRDLLRIVFACVSVNAMQYVGMAILSWSIPRSFPVIAAVFTSVGVCASRILFRMYKTKQNRGLASQHRVRTMVIGAGQSGAMVVREFINNHHSHNRPVCIIDDDPRKVGNYLYGVKVIGDRSEIERAVVKYRVSEIVFAIPEANAQNKHDILKVCQNTGCTLKIVPSLYQLANGEVSIQKIRSVDINDLLGRDAIEVNIEQIAEYVCAQTVLVTGGGGSIGSELCRQIAAHKPKKLIIFDIYENNAYDIQFELKNNYPRLELEVLIGSVRDEKRVNMLFETYRPDIVYHAAAHKHVPLMEDSPNEAIKNNVFGTYNVASAADRYGVKTMVLISTDKAVNPTNIMGASKRVCEMVIQTFAKTSRTRFVAVRFGNVLGSNGSVIPLFKKQISAGGPVTVTHKDIIRYFMTIPEAVSLVMQAGAYAKGGEIFVLDMGSPVKIDTLARNMIKLSGFEPDIDIQIVYTGLRPGEKLYEEILMAEEGLDKTPNNLIFIGHPNDFDTDSFFGTLEKLKSAAMDNDAEIKDIMETVVSTYRRVDKNIRHFVIPQDEDKNQALKENT